MEKESARCRNTERSHQEKEGKRMESKRRSPFHSCRTFGYVHSRSAIARTGDRSRTTHPLQEPIPKGPTGFFPFRFFVLRCGINRITTAGRLTTTDRPRGVFETFPCLPSCASTARHARRRKPSLAVVRPPTVSSLAVAELTRRSYLVRSALRGILQIGFPCFAVVRTHEQIRFPRFSGAA